MKLRRLCSTPRPIRKNVLEQKARVEEKRARNQIPRKGACFGRSCVVQLRPDKPLPTQGCATRKFFLCEAARRLHLRQAYAAASFRRPNSSGRASLVTRPTIKAVLSYHPNSILEISNLGRLEISKWKFPEISKGVRHQVSHQKALIHAGSPANCLVCGPGFRFPR